VSRITKWFLAVIVSAGAAVLTSREVLWRIDHVPAGPTAVTLAGIVFETYLLPERSAAPYGVGVFARRSWNPLRSVDSTLVFAAYCGKDFALSGASDAVLEITCSLQEGPPKLLVKSFAGVLIRLHSASG
jgi:hypothetical protein